MNSSGIHTVHDRFGLPIKAQFSVESVDGETSVVVESRGGKIGSSNERNTQYNLGIELLLGRLADTKCRLRDAVLDTVKTKQQMLSRDERRLMDNSTPIDLASADLHLLRISLCSAQREIGRQQGAKGPGNSTKRMRLYVSGLPANLSDAARLLARHPFNTESDDDINSIVRPYRSSRRSGRGLTAKERKAVEQRAMEVTHIHLSSSWTKIKDVSATKPCDFICYSDEKKLYVEVKGTTGLGESVTITRNELALARAQFPNTLLAVVSEIELDRGTDPPTASGGNLTLLSPWVIQQEDLEPLAFEYKVKTIKK